MKCYSSEQLQDETLPDNIRNMIYCGIDTANTLELYHKLSSENRNEYSYERNKKLILDLMNKKQPKPDLKKIKSRTNILIDEQLKLLEQISYVYQKFVENKTFNIRSSLQKKKLFTTLKFKPRNKGSWGIETLDWYSKFGKEEQKSLVSLFLNYTDNEKQIKTLNIIKTPNLKIVHDIKNFKFSTRQCGLVYENLSIDDYNNYFECLGYNHLDKDYLDELKFFEEYLNINFKLEEGEPPEVLIEWLLHNGPLLTANKLGILPKEIKVLFKEYEKKYPEVIEYKESLRQELYETSEIIHPITGTIYPIFDRPDSEVSLRKALSFLTNELYLDNLSKQDLTNIYILNNKEKIGIIDESSNI